LVLPSKRRVEGSIADTPAPRRKIGFAGDRLDGKLTPQPSCAPDSGNVFPMPQIRLATYV